MPPKFEDSGKKLLLQKVLANKDVLFGNFDESKGRTKQTRIDAWNEIHKDLSALGYPVGKDGKYIRDTTFQNIRKSTMVSDIDFAFFLIECYLLVEYRFVQLESNWQDCPAEYNIFIVKLL